MWVEQKASQPMECVLMPYFTLMLYVARSQQAHDALSSDGFQHWVAVGAHHGPRQTLDTQLSFGAERSPLPTS